MDAPRFYIFGVPDGFDMLDGSSQEISYFQRFYDGSTEDTKFTMHRANGIVTYSYLKYNLSSGKSRTGSFFGMSLAFSGLICNHPLKLYELFEYVYNNHILCNTSDVSNGILKPIVNSDIKAQYLITRFDERKEYIKYIEKVVLHNLGTNDVLSTAFYPLDPGFKNENQNLVVKLPLVEGLDETQLRLREENLINRFREYGYVTISPDWKPVDDGPSKEDIELAPQTILQWKELITNYQRYIIQGLGNIATVDLDDVLKYQKQTEAIINQLRNYGYNKNIAPSLPSDYEELRNQLADLHQKATAAHCGGEGTSQSTKDPVPPTPKPSLIERISANKGKIAGIAGAVVVAVVLLVLFRPKNDAPKHPRQTSYCCVESVDDSIGKALSVNDFKKATEIADTISDKGFKEEKLALIEESISKYHVNLNKEIDKLIGDKKWKDAFDKTEDYYGENAKKDELDIIRKECVDYFKGEISKITPNNYSFKATHIIKDLDSVKNYIGDDYNSLKNSIESIKSRQESTPKNTYTVELWKGNREVYNQLKSNHSRNADGKMSISTSCDIEANGIHGVVFRLVNQNGTALPLQLKDIEYQGVKCTSNTSGWIDVTSIENNATIKIKEANIVITFKKGE